MMLGMTSVAGYGRCAVLSAYGEPLELREYAVPDPEPGAVLLRVTQASICGSDLHMWRGDSQSIPVPAGGRALGHEGAAVVERLGNGVDTDSLGQPLRVGDRVVHSIVAGCNRCDHCGAGEPNLCRRKPPAPSAQDAPHFFGTFADYLYLRPGTPLFKVASTLPDDILSPVNCAMGTVLAGLQNGGVGPGKSVVLYGAGGLGLTGVALAKHLGAGCVIAIDRLTQRLELAREFGADEVIDATQVATAEERVAIVKEMTGGGADVVLELVGSAALFSEGVEMLDRGGAFVEIGLFFTGKTIAFDPASIVVAGKRIIGSNGYRPLVLPVILDFLARRHDTLPFDRLVSHRFKLADINDAFSASEWQQANTAVVRAVVEP
jgi:threonine dehydrogenase-like Zn-dependent dehydrogenase